MQTARTFFDQLAHDLDRYIRHHVQYDTPDDTGATKRKQLESFRRQLEKTGRTAEQLDAQFSELIAPTVVPYGRYLLNTFSELSATRSAGMGGPCAITYQEILAYCSLTDTELEPWEVDAIRLCDRAFLEEAHEVMNKQTKT